jgi:hypothetical protein
MSRTDSAVDCPCEAISDIGIGVGRKGKTPAFDAEQVQKVLDTIDTSNEVGFRDRALLSKAPTGSLQRQHHRERVRFEPHHLATASGRRARI